MMFSTSFSQTDHPFTEHEIIGRIIGSESIIVDDFNEDGKSDILAFPVLDSLVGVYTNIDSLDFSFSRYNLGMDINSISVGDFYPDNGMELIVTDGSTINIIQLDSGTCIIKKSYPLSQELTKLTKTNQEGVYIGLSDLGELMEINIDTSTFTMDNIGGLSYISSYTIAENTSDTINIFSYSNFYQTLSHSKIKDTTEVTTVVSSSLNINPTFSVHDSNGFNIVCSSKLSYQAILFKQNGTSFSQQTLSYTQRNKPVLHSKNRTDTIIFHISGLDASAYPSSTYYLGDHQIYESKIFNNSIFQTDIIMEHINNTNTMISINMDNDIDNEYVLFSDLYDQITIYENSDSYFNISRCQNAFNQSAIMVDFDLDGDLDAVAKIVANSYSTENTEYTWFENRGNFEFRNHIIYRTYQAKYLRGEPSVINFQGRPNVFYSAKNFSSSYTRVLRLWQDDFGVNQVELLDTNANGSSLYSHNKMFTGDVDGDNDVDLIIKDDIKVQIYQNRGTYFKRLVNTYGGGLLYGDVLNYYSLYDYNNNGVDNLFLMKASSYSSDFVICDSVPTGNVQLSTTSGPLVGQVNSYDNYSKAEFQDFNFDGELDFLCVPQSNEYKFMYIENIGNLQFDTANVKRYTTIQNGDTVEPIIAIAHDYENNFKPEFLDYYYGEFSYSKQLDDSTYNKQLIYNIPYYFITPSIVRDFDFDGDADFVGVNNVRGVSYYENITCNTKYVLDTAICSATLAPDGTTLLDQPGDYYVTIPNVNGCDSTIWIQLTNLSSDTSLIITSCGAMLSPDGLEVWGTNGIYIDTVDNIYGCDSVITVDLTVYDSIYQITEFSCDSFVSPSQTEVWYSSGVYMDTLTAQNGCDSVIEIDLDLSYSSYSMIYESACDSFTSINSNATWYNSGIYYDTIPNTSGCDSVVTISLDVNSSYVIIIDTSICLSSGIQIGDSNYTQQGNYLDTLQSIDNCDSIIHLNLEVVEEQEVFIDTVICSGDSITVGNMSYSSTGIYIDTLLNFCNLDSIVHLDLIVDNNDPIFIDTTLCYGETLFYNETLFNEAGVHETIVTNEFGCNTLVTINVSVNNYNYMVIDTFLCQNESLTIGNELFTDEGQYTATLQDIMGCDSIIDITITKNDLTVVVQDGVFTTLNSYSNYTWISCPEYQVMGEGASFTPEVNGNYAVIINENGCVDTSKCVLIHNVGIQDINQTEIYYNITKNLLFIDYSQSEVLHGFDIIDVQGKIIYHDNKGDKTNEVINTGLFSHGVYTARLYFHNRIQYFRFIKVN